MRIYIIGGSGVGKTTLARILEKKYNIKHYELDKLVYDDNNGYITRSDKEIDKMFNEIIKEKSWIIEDVGRDNFIKGREMCDKIYYIKLTKLETLKRVILRWFRQRFGKEDYNYPPTLWQFYDMVRCAFIYMNRVSAITESLEPYMDKVIFLDKSKLKVLIINLKD